MVRFVKHVREHEATYCNTFVLRLIQVLLGKIQRTTDTKRRRVGHSAVCSELFYHVDLVSLTLFLLTIEDLLGAATVKLGPWVWSERW